MKKVIKHHTPTEKLFLRRQKRKKGPAAIRRRERREHLQPRLKDQLEEASGEPVEENN